MGQKKVPTLNGFPWGWLQPLPQAPPKETQGGAGFQCKTRNVERVFERVNVGNERTNERTYFSPNISARERSRSFVGTRHSPFMAVASNSLSSSGESCNERASGTHTNRSSHDQIPTKNHLPGGIHGFRIHTNIYTVTRPESGGRSVGGAVSIGHEA